MALEELIDRDGGTCVWCGAEPWSIDLSVEHLLPRARRGRGREENLAVACRRCNRRRGTRSVVAYVRAQLREGRRPRLDLLGEALMRLSGSSSPAHADYGRRQLALLAAADLPVCAGVGGGRASAERVTERPRPARER